MSFNDNISLDTSGVDRQVGRRRGLKIGGGISGLGVAAAILYFALTGNINPSLLSLGSDSTGSAQSGRTVDISAQCQTGADANRDPYCRMVAGKNSLDAFWGKALPSETKASYQPAKLTLYDGATSTACGTGTSDIGPFYCPGDDTVYMDVSFFNRLQSMGAENTSLAQLYILAHEWGHHIQNRLGILTEINHDDLGPNGDMVRSELQADCLAGAWINNASTTVDPDTGETYMKRPTQEELSSALAAASAVGDDKIYENAGMKVNPDNFSHGSAEKRMQWLNTGMQSGTIAACNTWDVAQP